MATTAPATDAQAAVLFDLITSTEVHTLIERLNVVQQADQASGEWDTVSARRVEAALGYLRMAVEVATPGNRVR